MSRVSSPFNSFEDRNCADKKPSKSCHLPARRGTNQAFGGQNRVAELDACSLKTEEWMNTEEAARYLRLSVGALRNLTSNGKVPYHKLGNRNRYLLDDLRKLLLANKRGAFNYE